MRFDVIRHLVNYYLERRLTFPVNVSFAVITNGTLLTDEIVDFMGKNRFTVMFSIDGGNSVALSQRPYANGSSSYRDDTDALISLMKNKGISLKARMTITPKSLNLVDNILHLQDVGFEDISLLADMEEPWSDEDNLRNLKNALKELADKFISEALKGNILQIDIFRNYLAKYILSKQNEKYRQNVPCYSGRTVIGISVDGDIYPCHHWNNQSNRTPCKYDYREFRTGSLSEGINHKIRERFSDFSSDNIEKCVKCPARFICGGPCYAISQLYYGDIGKVFPGQCNYMAEVDRSIKYVCSTLKMKNKDILLNILDSINQTRSCCN